jgi:hypothetical protein
MKRKFLVLALMMAVACWASTASAVTIDSTGYTFTAGTGSAFFQDVGGTVTLVLSNTDASAAYNPTDIITAFFWYSGTTLTPVTSTATTPGTGAFLTGGSTYVNFSSTNENVGGEWAYNTGLNVLTGQNQGVNAAGLGLPNATPSFGGSNLDGPAAVDGIDFSLLGIGGIASGTGVSADITGNPLINNSVTFTFTGAPDTFDIDSVQFYYGTSNVPQVPIPPTALLLGSGLLGIVGLGWRRRRS